MRGDRILLKYTGFEQQNRGARLRCHKLGTELIIVTYHYAMIIGSADGIPNRQSFFGHRCHQCFRRTIIKRQYFLSIQRGLQYFRHRGLGELFVFYIEVGPALLGIRIPVDILLVGDVFFVRKGAGNPLPRKGIGTPITIEQMGIHPLGRQFPVGAGQVAGKKGRVHPLVVVHISRRYQSLDANVDPVNARGSRRDRGGNRGMFHPLLIPSNILIDPIAQTHPHPLKKIAPSQLLHKPKHLLKTVSPSQQIRPNHTCRNHPTRYVRTQFTHTPRYIIAGLPISLRINRREQCLHFFCMTHRLLILLLEIDFCRLQ